MQNGVTEDMQCMQGIGYKEVAEGLRLGLSTEEIKEKIKGLGLVLDMQLSDRLVAALDAEAASVRAESEENK